MSSVPAALKPDTGKWVPLSERRRRQPWREYNSASKMKTCATNCSAARACIRLFDAMGAHEKRPSRGLHLLRGHMSLLCVGGASQPAFIKVVPNRLAPKTRIGELEWSRHGSVFFIAWLNGFQDRFVMLNGAQAMRPLPHFVEIFKLADANGMLGDPELAVARMRKLLAV